MCCFLWFINYMWLIFKKTIIIYLNKNKYFEYIVKHFLYKKYPNAPY